MSKEHVFSGTLMITEPGGPKHTVGAFSVLINQNVAVFDQYFGAPLYPGSLNVKVLKPASLQEDFDNGVYEPGLRIPQNELVGMPPYIGDGLAWRCVLGVQMTGQKVDCWIFRRIGSRVSHGVIEVVATEGLVGTYGLKHDDPVTMTLYEGRR